MSPLPNGTSAEPDPARSRNVLEENIYLNVLELQHNLERDFRELFDEHGLTPRQYNVLRILYVRGSEGLPCQVIRELLVTSVSDISRLIDRMSEKDFVERERSEEDRRVVLIHLTDKGANRCEAVDDQLVNRVEKQFDHMERDELEQLNELLLNVLDGFKPPSEGGD